MGKFISATLHLEIKFRVSGKLYERMMINTELNTAHSMA